MQFPTEDAKKGMMDFGLSDDVNDQMVELDKAINDGKLAVNEPRMAKNFQICVFLRHITPGEQCANN